MLLAPAAPLRRRGAIQLARLDNGKRRSKGPERSAARTAHLPAAGTPPPREPGKRAAPRWLPGEFAAAMVRLGEALSAFARAERLRQSLPRPPLSNMGNDRRQAPRAPGGRRFRKRYAPFKRVARHAGTACRACRFQPTIRPVRRDRRRPGAAGMTASGRVSRRPPFSFRRRGRARGGRFRGGRSSSPAESRCPRHAGWPLPRRSRRTRRRC